MKAPRKEGQEKVIKMMWTVTLRTGTNTWSTIEVPGTSPAAAIARAKRLLGNYPCSKIV